MLCAALASGAGPFRSLVIATSLLLLALYRLAIVVSFECDNFWSRDVTETYSNGEPGVMKVNTSAVMKVNTGTLHAPCKAGGTVSECTSA